MKSAMCLTTFLLMCTPAHAYELETGSITICDTQKQMERFVQLFDGNPQAAMSAVNTEENNPNALRRGRCLVRAGPQIQHG
jgi:hypothetical protein